MTPELGKIITKEVTRDAVHIAIAPVIAAERLAPGERVGIVGTTEGVVTVGKQLSPKEFTFENASWVPVGIVDPFLDEPVLRGQRFWLCLYPNTVTSLRHHWTHPAFPVADTCSMHEAWIRAYARSVEEEHGEPLSYEKLMWGAAGYVADQREALVSDGSAWMNLEVPDEFWDHYEGVTGVPVPEEKRGSFFSCSC